MADKKSEGGAGNAERNSLRRSRPRERTRASDKPTERPDRNPVNAIEQVPTRQAAAAASEPDQKTKETGPSRKEPSNSASPKREEEVPQPQAVPDHIRRRFVQVGRKYYFPDGIQAFTDRGHRLTTASENSEVIKSLVEIAKSRGWGEISVHGSERFRREAWMTAKLAGLEVRGFRPSPFEEGKLVRLLAEKASPERRIAPLQENPNGLRNLEDKGSPRFVGKLLEHGRAPYRQDPKEPMSYFVRLATVKGERTIWGVDLERALKESLTQPKLGDEVGVVSSRREAVKVNVAERDESGQVSGQKSLDTHRNRWTVEKQTFFEGRLQAAQVLRDSAINAKQGAKDYPELLGTYLQVKAAEEAARKLKNPADRQQFLHLVRGALAAAVARGEPLPKVRMRDRTPPKRVPRTTEQAQGR